MKKFNGTMVGLCLFFGTACLASAQENKSMDHHPPKILTITREFVKPGKQGFAHDKTESTYVSAMAAAK